MSVSLSMRVLRLATVAGVLLLVSCSRAAIEPRKAHGAEAPKTAEGSTSVDADLSRLFSHIWKVAKAPSPAPAGSIYIFLPNGPLLETSCVEIYRIATWMVEKDAPRDLRVVEDGDPLSPRESWN